MSEHVFIWLSRLLQCTNTTAHKPHPFIIAWTQICGKVMFSQVSVCPSGLHRPGCHPDGCTPWMQSRWMRPQNRCTQPGCIKRMDEPPPGWMNPQDGLISSMDAPLQDGCTSFRRQTVVRWAVPILLEWILVVHTHSQECCRGPH